MAELTTGDRAPAFTLTDHEGNKFALRKQLDAGSRVFIFFYPKAMTPG